MIFFDENNGFLFGETEKEREASVWRVKVRVILAFGRLVSAKNAKVRVR